MLVQERSHRGNSRDADSELDAPVDCVEFSGFGPSAVPAAVVAFLPYYSNLVTSSVSTRIPY